MLDSVSAYDFTFALLRGENAAIKLRRRAFATSPLVWARLLALEACGPPVDRALAAAGLAGEAPPLLRRLLRESTTIAIQRAVAIRAQLTEIAALAVAHGVRILVLKGAARLLAGEMPGTRTISDIDLLVAPSETRLHSLLREELGYHVSGPGAAHHLPGLSRESGVGVEVHFRLSELPQQLDDAIWNDTRRVREVDGALEIPSPTALLLHTLDHAVVLNWQTRYRLRDLLDVAALHTPEISADRLRVFIRASPDRRALETLLAAARDFACEDSSKRGGALQTARRVGRARIALAVVPADPRVADRVFRYAGALAEASPVVAHRLGTQLVRRVAALVVEGLTVIAAISAAGCADHVSPGPIDVPPFVFTSDLAGAPGIYRMSGGVVTRLSAATADDAEPHSAAGRIVFMSGRDANAEIYVADLNLESQSRLTDDPSTDGEPALDPSAGRIAFVSSRTGAPRIWTMNVDGSAPLGLPTGTPTYVPETSPSWSPLGDQLAFVSTRTGTPQVYVVPASGGDAVQVTHETTGAFAPAWTPDGESLLYATGAGTSIFIIAPGGEARLFAESARGIGEPACNETLCLAVTDPYGAGGDLMVIPRAGGGPRVVGEGHGRARHPAFLVPVAGNQ